MHEGGNHLPIRFLVSKPTDFSVEVELSVLPDDPLAVTVKILSARYPPVALSCICCHGGSWLHLEMK
jgi:hypothetical protein